MVILLVVAIAGIVLNFILILFLLGRKGGSSQNISELKFQMEQNMRDEMQRSRTELDQSLSTTRIELRETLQSMSQIQTAQLESFEMKQNELNKETGVQMDAIRNTMERKIGELQESNDKKLDEIKIVVDDKLKESVENRFNESFKGISDRLDQVHQGLGEMQKLATGVGDLKKVLSNVKTRGNLGEMQLENILNDSLAPEQFEKNAATVKGSLNRVEFAIKLPGKEQNENILLPIDSKFPIESYERLLDAYEEGDSAKIESYKKELERSAKNNAKDINSKYINPPYTTDFGIMFIPTEGLYAEILRIPGLFEQIQREYKVTIVGPVNLMAFLNSLQMGFRTLAVEKRSSEVWELLGSIKTEFEKFGDVLEKTQKKIDEASRTLGTADVRTRAINRKLRGVEEITSSNAQRILWGDYDFNYEDYADLENN
ncbi:MAG: DNA recombination protein RmuC [Methanosarcinaceae archaeon]|nr:DNA recombination protein RmuC [Methanosarcinaceae archaeon]